MNDHPAQPVERPVGLETEYGILKPGDPYANPVALASRLVAAYGAVSRPALTGPDGAPAPAVRWDYEDEDPLADLRGTRLITKIGRASCRERV